MKNKFRSYLSNAYGFDQLSQHIYYLAIVLFIITLFTRSSFLRVLSLALLFYSLFRSLSSMRSKRARELVIYRKYQRILKTKFKLIKLNLTDRNHKYLMCKECHKQLRVPRHKGKIEVTCSNCRHKFDVKS